MRLEKELMEDMWFGNQDGMGIINYVLQVEGDMYIQFRSRYCNHNSTPHLNTNLVFYYNERKHGKCINNLGGKNNSLVNYIAHEIIVQ